MKTRVVVIVAVLGISGLALAEFAGAAGSIVAAAAFVGLASTLIVRGLFRG